MLNKKIAPPIIVNATMARQTPPTSAPTDGARGRRRRVTLGRLPVDESPVAEAGYHSGIAVTALHCGQCTPSNRVWHAGHSPISSSAVLGNAAPADRLSVVVSDGGAAAPAPGSNTSNAAPQAAQGQKCPTGGRARHD